MKVNLVPETQLEAMMCDQVAIIKAQYSCWSEPELLCKELRIRISYGSIGLGSEGAAFADAIQLDPTAGVPARRRFTFYHEIVHHLLREHAVELFSIINDQYESDELLTKISERLCNVGAAEFRLPRATVHALYQEDGFSVELIAALTHLQAVSRVAACAQLAFCAPHACIAIVCRKYTLTSPLQPHLQHLPMPHPTRTVVKIDAAFRSSKMKYPCASGTIIPSSHFVANMFEAAHGKQIRSKASIPFKSGKIWEVDCEAVRLGKQIFAFFHQNSPPPSMRNQLRLPF